MIEIDSLVHVYDGRQGTRAVDGITFSVEAGDLFGFLGPNGAGKTTTIRILATLLEPTRGTVRVDGHDVLAEPLRIRERIGYMPERPGFYPTMRGLDHLLYWAEFYGLPGAERRARAQDLLAQVGLAEAADKRLKAYSHGMRQRLALAQALLNDPPVLILDEPAGGLDPAGMRFFRELVRRLNGEGKTIFLSSHLLSEVEQTCRTVGVIHRGRMVAVSALAALQRRVAATRQGSLEVVVEGVSEEALAALRTLEGVLSVDREGDRLTLAVQAGSDLAAEVNATLVLHGARVRSLREADVRLEDVFVALTKEEGA